MYSEASEYGYINYKDDSVTKKTFLNKTYSFCSRLLLVLGAILGILKSVHADNPYTADPAPIVVGDRVYLLADHDENGSTNYNMKDWRLFSTTVGTTNTDHKHHEHLGRIWPIDKTTVSSLP